MLNSSLCWFQPLLLWLVSWSITWACSSSVKLWYGSASGHCDELARDSGISCSCLSLCQHDNVINFQHRLSSFITPTWLPCSLRGWGRSYGKVAEEKEIQERQEATKERRKPSSGHRPGTWFATLEYSDLCWREKAQCGQGVFLYARHTWRMLGRAVRRFGWGKPWAEYTTLSQFFHHHCMLHSLYLSLASPALPFPAS